MGTVCKKLGWRDRWYTVKPDGRSGGLLLGWAESVTVFQVVHTTFSIEIEFETEDSGGKLWGIFVYVNNKEKIKQTQWAELLQRNMLWGSRWILGGA